MSFGTKLAAVAIAAAALGAGTTVAARTPAPTASVATANSALRVGVSSGFEPAPESHQVGAHLAWALGNTGNHLWIIASYADLYPWYEHGRGYFDVVFTGACTGGALLATKNLYALAAVPVACGVIAQWIYNWLESHSFPDEGNHGIWGAAYYVPLLPPLGPDIYWVTGGSW
jgi:hypothetical protein